MKYFKCAQCKSVYKIDETKITTTKVMVVCTKCGTKNVLNFGPVLIAQSKDSVSKFNLKEGANLIGRKSKKSEADFLVEDAYVSRKHVVVHIENRDQKIFVGIEDIGSLNGTFSKHKNRLKPKLKYPFLKDDYYIIGLTKLSLQIE